MEDLMNEHRVLIFVVAVLYSMDEKWRGMGTSRVFDDMLENRHGVNLHTAWLKLKREGLLGEFSDQFYFNTLYGASNLSDILCQAYVRYMLIRLDGNGFSYHLDQISPEAIGHLLRRENISLKLVKQVSARLNILLDEQAALVASPTAK
jgi:hypothetical protein